MSGTSGQSRIVKYDAVCLFMCLFPSPFGPKSWWGDDIFSCQKQNYERQNFPLLIPTAAFDFAAVVPAAECFPLPPPAVSAPGLLVEQRAIFGILMGFFYRN